MKRREMMHATATALAAMGLDDLPCTRPIPASARRSASTTCRRTIPTPRLCLVTGDLAHGGEPDQGTVHFHDYLDRRTLVKVDDHLEYVR